MTFSAQSVSSRSAIAFSWRAALWSAIGPAFVWIGALAVGAWRLHQMGAYPTGLDGGNWLAFGSDIFGGIGKSTPGVYPPLVPVLAHLGSLVLEPTDATRLLAISSSAAVFLAVALVGREVGGAWFGVWAGVLVILSKPVVEAIAFGGYPQNFAVAFMIWWLWALATALREGGTPRWLMVGNAALFTGLTHHMYFGVALGCSSMVWLLWASTLPSRPILAKRTLATFLTSLAGLVAFAPTFIALLRLGYEAPLNSADSGLRGHAGVRACDRRRRCRAVPFVASDRHCRSRCASRSSRHRPRPLRSPAATE